MIPFDFKYMAAENVEEALLAWKEADQQEEHPLYYAGGTEIITLCREQKIKPGTVIDIKNIGECRHFSESGIFSYGAALSLNRIVENTSIPLLSRALSGIADHTIRNRLTLGGNIMGALPYREAVLPFLVLDGSALIASGNGVRKEGLLELFNKKMNLGNGELLLQMELSPPEEGERWYFARRTRNGRVDYPLLSACFAGNAGNIKMAVSGSFSCPIRSIEAEQILDNPSIPAAQRAEQVIALLDTFFRSDFRSSADYRKHLLKLAITDALEYLENDHENILRYS